MIVLFPKRFSREDLKRVNELIAKRGKDTVIEALSSLQDEDNSSDRFADVRVTHRRISRRQRLIAGLAGMGVGDGVKAEAETHCPSPGSATPVTGGGIDLPGPAAVPRLPPTLPDAVTPSPAPAQPPTDAAPEQPKPTESIVLPSRWLDLDRLGVLQLLGGIALSLIALFSSYDHITLLGRTLQLQRQWGIIFIAASLATVVVDAELASGSRLRAAHVAVRAAQDAARRADEAARERYRADQERQRADRERNRAAEARERQRQATARLDRCALLSARVQLDPSVSNRARLQSFLALMGQRPLEDEQGIGGMSRAPSEPAWLAPSKPWRKG